MKKKIIKLLKNGKWLIVGALSIVFIVILIQPYFTPVKSFTIQDKCGQFVNLLSHTIPDENACELRCKGQCKVTDNKFKKIEFEKKEKRCNVCTCFCK